MSGYSEGISTMGYVVSYGLPSFAILLILIFLILCYFSRQDAYWYLPLVFAPAAGGALIGYTVGLCETPIVATFIPVLIGLLGAVGYAEAKNQRFVVQLKERLNSAVADEGEAQGIEKIKKLLNESSPAHGVIPALAGLGTFAFFFFCGFGMDAGLKNRLPSYQGMETLLVKYQPLTPEEALSVAQTSWALRKREIPVREHDQLLVAMLKPVLEKTSEREKELVRVSEMMQKSIDSDANDLVIPGPPVGATPFLKSAAAVGFMVGLDVRLSANAVTYEEAYIQLLHFLLGESVKQLSSEAEKASFAKKTFSDVLKIDADFRADPMAIRNYEEGYKKLKKIAER
ncbi:hypothetical protein [Blastopirellula marina]|nr:hypothetical protein [Blastopirellula marina]